MRHFVPKLIALVLFWSVLILSCKSNDPAPLGAQKNATLLAGAAGKDKTWKLRELTYQFGTGASQTQTLIGCFSDNLYKFSNSAAQSYTATEGASKCYSSDAIEGGTWSFTLDGLRLNIEVDNTQTPNGLFSPEPTYGVGDTTNIKYFSQLAIYPYNFGYTPFPAFVKKLDDNNLILEYNYTLGSTVYKYTLTFTPA